MTNYEKIKSLSFDEMADSVGNINGIPIVNYNDVVFQSDEKIRYNGKEYDRFYISYNSHDTEIYRSETTALVLGQMQKFFILNGNHCVSLEKLAKENLNHCIAYIHENKSKLNKFSDEI